MHDEELSRRMMTLAADAERAARLASAPSIRARGGRRRFKVAGALGLAAGLAALVGYSITAGIVPNLGSAPSPVASARSEEHTSELQSRVDLVCRLLLEKKKKKHKISALSQQKKKNNL